MKNCSAPRGGDVAPIRTDEARSLSLGADRSFPARHRDSAPKPPSKARPIIMSAPMVRAILAGAKSVTRRVVKPQPNGGLCARMVDLGSGAWGLADGDLSGEWPCPYGVPGDRLWVRETWLEDRIPELTPEQHGHIHYRADEIPVVTESWSGQWRPSIFMPRWASRITLEVEEARVERLQEIRREDALAEGIERQFISNLNGDHYHWGDQTKDRCSSAITAYRALWDSINAKRAPWESNPFVWVVEFRRLA